MSTANYILVVDDEPDIRTLVSEILADEGYEVATAANGESAREALRHRRPDLMLLDIWMPDIDGISLLQEWGESGRLPCPIIMMSGHGTVETAVEATRLGAYDFVEKPLSLAKLLLTIERALETKQLQEENVGLKQHLLPLDEPLGHSQVMQQLREQIKRIANHDTWVLISGEAGTGKMSFAKYLHNLSDRKSGPFIEINAGSLSGDTAATELFGAEHQDKVIYGRLEQANKGTLFIDEVADLDLQTQTRLLSALQSQTFVRINGSEPVQIDVRVIAATRLDLPAEVRAGKFREDLFYHLNVVPIHVPPLRDHAEDVPDLLNFYTDVFARRDGLSYRKFSVAAQNRLRQHSWPGNIRELRNLVQRLMILGNGEDISQTDVERALGTKIDTNVSQTVDTSLFEMPLREARELFERQYFEYQLKAVDGNISQLAKKVGMERTNLYRKLRSLGVNMQEN